MSGGTQITITGSHLTSVTAVDFGSMAGTNLSINTAGTQLTVDSPAEAAGVVDVKLASLGAAGGSLDTGVKFYFEGVPAVTSVSPKTVDAAGNTQVTITGTGLYPASAVYFVNTQDTTLKYAALSFVDDSPTQIVAAAPGGLVEVDYYEYVTATTPAGTSPNPGTNGEVSFANTPPTIAGISTTTGPAEGGTPVTITGTNFYGAYEVLFGEQPERTSLDVISETRISVVSPENYPGTYPVTVVRNDGVSNSVNFTYTASAYITSVSPSSGLVTPGTLVTITGVNILPFEDVIDFGSIALTPLTVSETTITAISPVLPASYQGTTVDIKIFTNYGWTPVSPADEFSYVSPGLGISSLSQSSGPVGGGTTVTITGTNLANATAVDFGSVAGTIVSGTNTSTSIEAVSPPSQGYNPGTVNVTVQTPYGPTPSVPADDFTYYATGPVVSGVSPEIGMVGAQTTVTISGSGLSNPSAVNFGGVQGTIVSFTDSQIVAKSPASNTPARST